MTGTAPTTCRTASTSATRFDLPGQSTVKAVCTCPVEEHARLRNILTFAQGQRFTTSDKERNCTKHRASEFRIHRWDYWGSKPRHSNVETYSQQTRPSNTIIDGALTPLGINQKLQS
jgi:hypothetical protein